MQSSQEIQRCATDTEMQGHSGASKNQGHSVGVRRLLGGLADARSVLPAPCSRKE